MRRNLTLLVAATTTAVVLALVIPLALLVGRLAQDRAIAAATQQAQSVALLIATDTPAGQLGSLLTLSDERSGLRTSVVLATGAALGPPVGATDLARRARWRVVHHGSPARAGTVRPSISRLRLARAPASSGSV